MSAGSPGARAPVIETHLLGKVYAEGTEAQVVALKDVGLAIRRGDFVAIMGPSGSGKSTLMNLIGCLDTPSSGRYLCDGIDVATLDAEERAILRRDKIGFVFQGFNLLPRMSALENVGQQVLSLMAEGLRLDTDYFQRHFTADPTVLFRIFRYPPDEAAREGWGVGAHTDYGLLTLLQQDAVGGLQVLNRDRWLDVPPLADSLVCNVGDMLERLTNGRYLSALHRAKNLSARERLSMVLFLDPSFDAKLEPLPGVVCDSLEPHTNVRWDRIDPHAMQGTYGEYLLSKVSKVFPDLAPQVL